MLEYMLRHGVKMYSILITQLTQYLPSDSVVPEEIIVVSSDLGTIKTDEKRDRKKFMEASLNRF